MTCFSHPVYLFALHLLRFCARAPCTQSFKSHHRLVLFGVWLLFFGSGCALLALGARDFSEARARDDAEAALGPCVTYIILVS